MAMDILCKNSCMSQVLRAKRLITCIPRLIKSAVRQVVMDEVEPLAHATDFSVMPYRPVLTTRLPVR